MIAFVTVNSAPSHKKIHMKRSIQLNDTRNELLSASGLLKSEVQMCLNMNGAIMCGIYRESNRLMRRCQCVQTLRKFIWTGIKKKFGRL